MVNLVLDKVCMASALMARHSNDEAVERRQGRAEGDRGGKAADGGEHGTVHPVPDAESGERAKRTGTRASSSNREQRQHGSVRGVLGNRHPYRDPGRDSSQPGSVAGVTRNAVHNSVVLSFESGTPRLLSRGEFNMEFEWGLCPQPLGIYRLGANRMSLTAQWLDHRAVSDGFSR